MLNIWNNYYKSDIIVNSQENFDIENENKTNFKEHMPVFKYKLRTISDNKIKEKLNSEGLKYLPWIKVPVSYIRLRLS